MFKFRPATITMYSSALNIDNQLDVPKACINSGRFFRGGNVSSVTITFNFLFKQDKTDKGFATESMIPG